MSLLRRGAKKLSYNTLMTEEEEEERGERGRQLQRWIGVKEKERGTRDECMSCRGAGRLGTRRRHKYASPWAIFVEEL